MESANSTEVADTDGGGKIMQVVEWAYDKAVNGVIGLDSAQELAESYRDNNLSVYEQANSLIRWQNSKAATSGFVTGLGGLLVLPVTLPANIASVMYVQIRMIAAIAHLGGYDVRNDKVKLLSILALQIAQKMCSKTSG